MDNATFNHIQCNDRNTINGFCIGLISIVLGVLLGIVVFITRPNHICSNKIIHAAFQVS